MNTIHRILSIVSLVLAWLILSFVFSPTIVPGPFAVLQAMWENVRSGQAFYHLYKTLFRVGFGLVLTMALGIAFGTAMGLSRRSGVFLGSPGMAGPTLPGMGYILVFPLWC